MSSHLPEIELNRVKQSFPVELVEKPIKEYIHQWTNISTQNSELRSKLRADSEIQSRIPKRLVKKSSVWFMPEYETESLVIEHKDSYYSVGLEIVDSSREWDDLTADLDDKPTITRIRNGVSMIVSHAVNYWSWFVSPNSSSLKSVELKMNEKNLTLRIDDSFDKVLGPVVRKL